MIPSPNQSINNILPRQQNIFLRAHSSCRIAAHLDSAFRIRWGQSRCREGEAQTRTGPDLMAAVGSVPSAPPVLGLEPAFGGRSLGGSVGDAYRAQVTQRLYWIVGDIIGGVRGAKWADFRKLVTLNKEGMANKNNKETSSSILVLFAWCFFGSAADDNVKRRNASSSTGPEADMVAAAKHFSSKVRLI
ncbi:hypothetical protein L484_026490 [Morus notabilis]|uniref:Uncharacterized protein n=1 Tax=Morus notabilis TaxID=981085 RepID=W9QNR9_9ROSA|nr:hypothetical protein L484_026490 [Morus notabilis]